MGHVDYAPSIFLIAHDPFTGRSEIPHGLLKCALATAELAYLLVDQRLTLSPTGELIAPRPNGLLPPDGLSVDGSFRGVDDYVVNSVAQRDAPGSPRDAIESIGPILYTRIASELVRAGTIQQSEHRRTGGTQIAGRFPAVNVLVASRPRLRLDQVIREPRTATLADALKIALICALQVEHLLEAEMSHAFRDDLQRNLPAQLRMLISEAELAAA